MHGVELSHHGPDCTFETILCRCELADPVLWKLAEAVTGPTSKTTALTRPRPAGLDAMLRGLSMTLDDPAVLAVTGPVFDGLYEYYRRATLLGRPPA